MQKLKVNVFNRYKDIVRKPLLVHKRETLLQIQKVSGARETPIAIADYTEEEEQQLMKEIKHIGSEGQLQLKRIKKLENRVDQLGLIV